MLITNAEREKIANIFSGNFERGNVCAIKDVLATFSDKWSIYAILLLGLHEKMRFNEMRGEIKGISQRMLTVTLRSLEENGLVSRATYSEIPPKVEYNLTSLGEGLLQQLLLLANWAFENKVKMLEAREVFKITHKTNVLPSAI